MNILLSFRHNKLGTFANEPAADNAGGFRRLAFNKPINDKGKVNPKQVKPALRLPAGRYVLKFIK